MIIIETCPKCGHDLMDLMIATYPPIPKKECPSCGWNWTGEPEQVMKVPFGGNSLECDKHPSLNDYTSLNLVVDDITDIINSVTKEEIEEYMKSTTNAMIANYVDKYYTD